MTKQQVVDRINKEFEGLFNYPEGESYLNEEGISIKTANHQIFSVCEPNFEMEMAIIRHPRGKFKAVLIDESGMPKRIKLV